MYKVIELQANIYFSLTDHAHPSMYILYLFQELSIDMYNSN